MLYMQGFKLWGQRSGEVTSLPAQNAAAATAAAPRRAPALRYELADVRSTHLHLLYTNLEVCCTHAVCCWLTTGPRALRMTVGRCAYVPWTAAATLPTQSRRRHMHLKTLLPTYAYA